VRARSWHFSLLSVAAMAGPAAAQALQDDEGPIILGQGPRWEWFRLERAGGFLELESRYSREERRFPGTSRVRDTELLLRETLGIDMEAYVGRKELLTLRGTGALSFRQSWLDRELEGGRRRELDWENLYDIRAFMLDSTRVPLTLHSLRTQSFISRPFAPTLESITMEHGIQATVRSERMPTTIRFFHRENEQIDRFGLSDFELVQDTFQLNTEYIFSGAHRLQFDYSYDNIEEASGPGFDASFERHDATLTHTINFGEQERSSLRSTGRYFRQIGEFDQERLRLDELLRLVHSERFETRYNLVLERVERSAATQEFVLGSAGLRWRLFESLVTSANIGASRLDVNGFRSETQFGDVNARYTKKVPYGRIDASIGAGLSRQEQGDRGQTLAVFDEPHTFNDPTPVTIFRRNVVIESIVITDAAGIRVYAPGIDYEIRSLPGRVEIRRVLGGAIADGETVLIDYLIGPEPGSTVETTTASVSVRYSVDEGMLAGLGLFGSARITDQRQTAGVEQAFLLNDAQVFIYGADYRVGGLTVSAEREHHDSDIAPFDALRFDARYHYIFSRRSALTIGGSHETIDYRDPGNRLQLARLFGIYTQDLTPHLDLQVEAIYRNERDDLSGDLQGFEQNVQLRWRKRQTEILGGFRNVMVEGDRGDTTFQSLMVTLRRNF
jgi:hypothetical protein